MFRSPILGKAAAEPSMKRSSSDRRQIHDTGTSIRVVGNNVGHGECIAAADDFYRWGRTLFVVGSSTRIY